MDWRVSREPLGVPPSCGGGSRLKPGEVRRDGAATCKVLAPAAEIGQDNKDCDHAQRDLQDRNLFHDPANLVSDAGGSMFAIR